MNNLKNQINAFREQFESSLENIKTEDQLEELRIAFLGRKGHLTALMAQLKTLSLEEKKIYGPLLNEVKQFTQQAFKEKQEELLGKKMLQATVKQQNFDVTAYKYKPLKGSLHIYSQFLEQLEDIFISMGYEIIEGPEVETDYYNFEAVNIPQDHPARDLQDTLWLDIPNMLLRTHTSSVQTHALETKELPIAIFSPGRCYRKEATDASHDFMFTQAEGFLIDKNISVANLLATVRHYIQKIFEKKDLDIRVRVGYFPYVEPGLEVDASCPFCTEGCSVCKQTRWLELGGAGLVHPNVLKCSGIDPEQYSGFAFGFGIERLAMLKHGINDIRLFHSSKIDDLDQF